MYISNRMVGNWGVICAVIIIIFSSCSASKKVPYFNDISDTIGRPLSSRQLHFAEPRIKPNDILSITIQTIDPSVSAVFNNNGGGTTAAGSGNTQLAGYLVDNNGEIELPMMGRIKLGGMTTIEARRVIREAAERFYVNPAVNVRFLNFNVTLLGDVVSPGTYNIQSERVSILDALGMAGDLSVTARRDNIMLMREENGEKVFIRLDINNSDLVSSPYFYLKTGDVLYIEPNKAKARNSTVDNTRDKYIGYSLSAVSIFISVVTFIRLLNN